MTTLPVCSQTNPVAACVGVEGNSQATDSVLHLFQNTYNDPTRPNSCGVYNTAEGAAVLKSQDKNGCCFLPDPKLNIDNSKSLARLTPLIIGPTEMGNLTDLKSATNPLNNLACLHKIWGETDNWKHGGVIKDNVSVTYNATVVLPDGSSRVQNVLRARITGDKYGADTPSGVQIAAVDINAAARANAAAVKVCPESTIQQKCNVYEATTNGGGKYYPKAGCRVGGVFTTADNFGPGKYEVLAMLPKTEWVETDGRGYVFALWTFHYAEMYWDGRGYDKDGNKISKICNGLVPLPPATGVAPANQYVISDPVMYNMWQGNSSVQASNPLIPGFSTPGITCFTSVGMDCSPPNVVISANGCRYITGIPKACSGGVAPCSLEAADNDPYTVMNHEIDIEIPSNSPQLTGPIQLNMTSNDLWKNNLTWGTMNCNTWLSDTGNYAFDTDAYYQQAMVRSQQTSNMDSFVSKNGEYHYYGIEWIAPTATDLGSVEFFFDRKSVFKTSRFVPSRAGRFNFGVWPGWWGSGGLSPQYDHADILFAELSITPTTLPTLNFPQTYDQDGLRCDVAAIPPLPTPPPPPPPPPPPAPKPLVPATKTCGTWVQCYWWVILIIVCVVVITVGTGLGVGLKKKASLTPL